MLGSLLTKEPHLDIKTLVTPFYNTTRAIHPRRHAQKCNTVPYNLAFDEGHPCPLQGATISYITCADAPNLETACKEGSLCKMLDALRTMDKQGLHISIDIFIWALQHCIKEMDIAKGRVLYHLIVKNGHGSNLYVCVQLIRLFAMCGSLCTADDVFGNIIKPNIFTWSAIISVHAKVGDGQKSIFLFNQMLESQIQPDDHIYVTLLQACANSRILLHGKITHALIVECCFESHIFICNAIINMYAKCIRFLDACSVFSKCHQYDVVTWNAIIEGYCEYDCGGKAVQLLSQMQFEGAAPDKVTFISILKACLNMGFIGQGRIFHLQMIESKFDSDPFVVSCLIDMYTKCVSLENACQVFMRSSNRDVVIWRAMLDSYAYHEKHAEALQLFFQMQQEGLVIGKKTYASVLKTCCDRSAHLQGKVTHVQVLENGCNADNYICSVLIEMYLEYGSIQDARRVFDMLHNPDIMTWMSIIGGYIDHGEDFEALQLFEQMYGDGLEPDKCMFKIILKACARAFSLEHGRVVHGYFEESELGLDLNIQASLSDMYEKCGEVEDARCVFLNLLKEQLDEVALKQNDLVVNSLLQLCSSLRIINEGMLIHYCVVESGFGLEKIKSMLIDMYVSCGSFCDAWSLFANSSNLNTIAWNAILAGCTNHCHCSIIIQLFQQMGQEGILPDQGTYLELLKSCTMKSYMSFGRLLHAYIRGSCFQEDEAVNCALIDMYANCGDLQAAQYVFDRMLSCSTATWNMLLAAYTTRGHMQKAFNLFQSMQEEMVHINTSTYVGILKACSSQAFLSFGKFIHGFIMELIGDSHVLVENSLIEMYTKCDSIEDAECVFGRLQNRNKNSWVEIMSSYAYHGHAHEALQVYGEMQRQGFRQDEVMFTTALKVCSILGALDHGKLLHYHIMSSSLEHNVFVGNTLINMYCKCGSLQDAQTVFQRLPSQDTGTWNSMIGGCANNNASDSALHFLKDMQSGNVTINAMTCLNILSACSHTGLLEDGIQHFLHMQDELGTQLTIEHYNCIIDLFGRTGSLQKAEDLAHCLPFSLNYAGWVSLLGHCQTHGRIELGNHCLQRILELDNRNASGYHMTSKLYTHFGLLENACRVEVLRKDVNAWKRPGLAYMDINYVVYEFSVGGHNHSETDVVFAKLLQLNMLMKDNGYLPAS